MQGGDGRDDDDDRGGADEGGDLVGELRAIEGADADAEARGGERAAARGGDTGPTDDLVERIQETGNLELPMERLAINAAALLKLEDPFAHASLRRALKGLGVSLGVWDAAVKERARQIVDEREAAAEAEAAEARARAKATQSENTARRRAEADDEVKLHYADPESNNVTYRMQPGSIWMERETKDGVRSELLAKFSAVIVTTLTDYNTPTATPDRTFVVSAIVGDSQPFRPFRVEVPASEFRRMEWVLTLLGEGACILEDSQTSRVRAAIQLASNSEQRRRNRFTGWMVENGEWLYVHAGGTIGARGALDGMVASPPEPARRFRLPAPPVGDELARCARAVVDLLNVEPADVSVPLVAAAFRAALGPTRCTVHVAGSPGTGKSMMAALAQQFFGPGMHAENLPCSWADGSTALGIQKALTRIGDAVVVVDDLQVQGDGTDARQMLMPKAILQGHFNRAAPLKLHQDGAEREGNITRCFIVSTGEVIPSGNSLRQRIIAVTLDRPVSPRLDGTGNNLMQRAADGELAGAMAAFIQWLAPNMAKVSAALRTREVTAARVWGLGNNDRSASLFGALAVGLDAALAWLEHVGALDEGEVHFHRDRARVALRKLVAENAEHIAQEDPAAKFIEHLRSALTSGAVYVTTFGDRPPPSAQMFGWKPTAQSTSAPLPGSTPGAPQMQATGKSIGYVDDDVTNGTIYINAEVAFAEVRNHALRLNDPLRLDAKSLGRTLHERKLLVETERRTVDGVETGTFTKRLRTKPGGKQVGGYLWLKIATLFPQEEAPAGAPQTPVEDPAGVSERAQGGVQATTDFDPLADEFPMDTST